MENSDIKRRELIMTKYYYASTNADMEIILVDEELDKFVEVGCPNGIDSNTNIDIYPDRDEYGEDLIEEKIKELSEAYQKLANAQMLYSVKDVEDEEPNRVHIWSEEEGFFEIEALLCEINYSM